MKIEEVKKLSPIERLIYWIQERESIRLKKEAGEPKPWTDDTILQSYRFCNVHREDDKVTQWIAKNWRNPNKHRQHVWFAMLLARYVNLPRTLESLGYPSTWDGTRFISVLDNEKKHHGTALNGAYMITTHKHKKPLFEYIAENVLSVAWQNRFAIAPTTKDTLSSFSKRLLSINGVSHFITGQVIADTKYCPVLLSAPDWQTWSIPGSGSKRGMHRIYPVEGKSLSTVVDIDKWDSRIYNLSNVIKRKTGYSLHAQDIQNCLCELDKYSRILLEESGRPKKLYSGVK